MLRSGQRWIVVVLLLLLASRIYAQEQSPSRIIINYVESAENANGQSANVYFALVDNSGKAITSPTIESAEVVLNSQVYPATITVPQTPLSIVLVLDASGSMQPAVETMKDAAENAVRSAPDGTLFAVYKFNNTVELLTNFTTDRNAALNAIGRFVIDPNGGTCLYDATFDAIIQAQSNGRGGRRAVILFTDGRDEKIRGGELDPCSTRADYSRVLQAAQTRQARVSVFTIGLTGTNEINVQELESLARDTGGLSAIGGQGQLNELFQQMIQALSSQRQATFLPCLPGGTYSGIINIRSGSANLSEQFSELTFNSTCVVPTSTSTELPPSIEMTGTRFDTATRELVFGIQLNGGSGTVQTYQIEIIDRNTNLPIDSADYGSFTVNLEQAKEIRIPAANIMAESWIINIKALDATGNTITSYTRDEIRPPRPSETPTPFPTLTSTPTETPIAPFVEIAGIAYSQDQERFVIDLNTVNVNASNILSYTVKIEDEGNRQVFSETRSTPPDDPLAVEATYNDGRSLPAGKYQIIIDLQLNQNSPPLRDEYEITKPEAPPPPPPPSVFEQIAINIQANPILALIFIIFVLAVFFLVYRLFNPNSREEVIYSTSKPISSSNSGSIQDDLNPATDVLLNPSAPVTLSDKGAKLIVEESPSLVKGHVFNFSSGDTPYRIGSGGTSAYPVKLHLRDSNASKVHAVITYHNGKYNLLDEGSTNGTYVDDELLQKGRKHALDSAQVIRMGLTKFTFVDNSEELARHTPPTTMGIPTVTAAPSGRIQVIQAPDQKLQSGQIFNVTKDAFWVGRSDTSDLIVDWEEISRQHVSFNRKNDQFTLIDSGSRNGTYVNGRKMAANEEMLLEAGKEYTITLGQKTRLMFTYTGTPKRATEELTRAVPDDDDAPTDVDYIPPSVEKNSLPGAVLPQLAIVQGANPAFVEISVDNLTIGRRKQENILVLDNSDISRQHARLFYQNHHFYIEDMGSANGTMVNASKLVANQPMELMPNQMYELRLGKPAQPIVMHFSYVIKQPVIDEDDPVTNVDK